MWQPYDARRSLIMDAQIEEPTGIGFPMNFEFIKFSDNSLGYESYATNYGNMGTRDYWKDASWFNKPEVYERGGRTS